MPQPGGFYGGWVTHELVGPFKGEAGTQGWKTNYGSRPTAHSDIFCCINCTGSLSLGDTLTFGTKTPTVKDSSEFLGHITMPC